MSVVFGGCCLGIISTCCIGFCKQEDENDLYTEDEFGDRVLKQKKDNKRPSAVTLEDSATAHTPLKQSESSRELEKLKQQLRDLGEDY